MSNTKDNKIRQKVAQHEATRKMLKAIAVSELVPDSERLIAYRQLMDLPRNSSSIRIRNRCMLTGRSRGVYSKFRLSRIAFRENAAKGFLPGVFKSSW